LGGCSCSRSVNATALVVNGEIPGRMRVAVPLGARGVPCPSSVSHLRLLEELALISVER